MRMLTMFFAVLLLAVTPVLSQTATQNQLQQTLAKIVFASQVTTINQLAHKSLHRETSAELQQAMRSDALVFSVDDFSSGQVADIANAKLVNYVTGPSDGRTLQITDGPIHVTNENGTVGDAMRATLRWTKGSAPNGSSFSALTVSGAFSLSSFPTCLSYINPTLTVSFQGQTVQWKALYFSNCADGKMYAIDPLMGDAVPDFWSADVYPY